MKITQAVMKQTYEDIIDKNIDTIQKIQSNGLSEKKDILLLDACLKYVILMSEIRDEE